MKKIIFSILLLALSQNSLAAWHNTSGTVESLNFYIHTGTIIVKLSSEGAPVEECSNTNSFAIHDSVPVDRRNQLLSALLSAQAAKTTVTISYNDVGGCVEYDGNPNAYRAIRRLIRK